MCCSVTAHRLTLEAYENLLGAQKKRVKDAKFGENQRKAAFATLDAAQATMKSILELAKERNLAPEASSIVVYSYALFDTEPIIAAGPSLFPALYGDKRAKALAFIAKNKNVTHVAIDAAINGENSKRELMARIILRVPILPRQLWMKLRVDNKELIQQEQTKKDGGEDDAAAAAEEQPPSTKPAPAQKRKDRAKDEAPIEANGHGGDDDAASSHKAKKKYRDLATEVRDSLPSTMPAEIESQDGEAEGEEDDEAASEKTEEVDQTAQAEAAQVDVDEEGAAEKEQEQEEQRQDEENEKEELLQQQQLKQEKKKEQKKGGATQASAMAVDANSGAVFTDAEIDFLLGRVALIQAKLAEQPADSELLQNAFTTEPFAAGSVSDEQRNLLRQVSLFFNNIGVRTLGADLLNLRNLQREQAEQQRKAEEAAEKKRKAEEAAEKKRKAEEAAAAAAEKKRKAEEAEKKRKEEEAEKKRKEEEAEKKRKEEEAEKKRKEEEAEKKRKEEEAAKKKKTGPAMPDDWF